MQLCVFPLPRVRRELFYSPHAYPWICSASAVASIGLHGRFHLGKLTTRRCYHFDLCALSAIRAIRAVPEHIDWPQKQQLENNTLGRAQK